MFEEYIYDSRRSLSILFILLTLSWFLSCVVSYEDQQIRDQYLEYLNVFHKDLTRIEDPQRILLFKKTVDLIHEHNSDLSHSYQIDLSEFADWSEEEVNERFQSRKLGKTERTLNVVTTKSFSSLLPSSLSILDSIDWSNTDNPLGYSVTPSIQNQLSCGGCWAFAASEAVTVSVNINQHLSPSSGKQQILSTQQLLDCDRNSINRTTFKNYTFWGSDFSSPK